MAWESNRPVPWERLMREWVIYAGVMAVIFLLFFRDGNVVGALAGVLISGPLYLVLGFVLAKFGYKRRTMKQLRADREQRTKTPTEPASGSTAPRGRPAPTKRTSQGPNRPSARKKR